MRRTIHLRSHTHALALSLTHSLSLLLTHTVSHTLTVHVDLRYLCHPKTLHCRYVRTSMKVHHSFPPSPILFISLDVSLSHTHSFSLSLSSFSLSLLFHVNLLLCSFPILFHFFSNWTLWERLHSRGKKFKCQINSLSSDKWRKGDFREALNFHSCPIDARLIAFFANQMMR